MRLGVVFMGTGAYAAAGIGVLRVLETRGIVPYAVCGMHFGAWIAAQYLCGLDAGEMTRAMKQAAGKGKKLLCAKYASGAMMAGREKWLCEGAGLNRIFLEQTRENMLGLCSRKGMFPCRIASSGQRVVFSTTAYAHGGGVSFAQQATIAFAARAAMAQPPFLSPMPWLGSYLLAEESAAFSSAQLLRLGVDRVLIVEPRAAMAHEPDALELAASPRRWSSDDGLPKEAGILRVMTPPDVSSLRFAQMERLADAGEEAARTQLDGALSAMGMAMCRVLPFKERAQALRCRC